jgi:CBS domain containing-hemolysin-like protein
MQKYKLGVIMVRESEFDGTAGLVTLQDLIRAIIGIEEEPPSPAEEPIIEQDNHTFIIQAQTDVTEVNEHLGIELPLLEEYQTLGGFILNHLQKIPAAGELFQYDNLEFKILSTEGPRIDRVLVRVEDVLTDPEPGLELF